MSLGVVVASLLCGVLQLDAPLVLTAVAPPSNADASLVPFLAVRGGFLDNDGPGLFLGGEGVAQVGYEQQGTSEVHVVRTPLLVEGRGLIGARWRGGLVGVGAYTVGAVGVGGGVALLRAFDDQRTRGFLLSTLRAGGGLELSFARATTRIELLAGLRDALRPELSSSLAVGWRF